MANAFSKLRAIKFSMQLAKKFPDWEAFKLGIIDKSGNIVRKPKTKEEKDSMDSLTNLIRKIKKLLIKFMPDSSLLNFLVVAYLLKSESVDGSSKLVDEIDSILTNEEAKIVYDALKHFTNL